MDKSNERPLIRFGTDMVECAPKPTPGPPGLRSGLYFLQIAIFRRPTSIAFSKVWILVLTAVEFHFSVSGRAVVHLGVTEMGNMEAPQVEYGLGHSGGPTKCWLVVALSDQHAVTVDLAW
jgi:hypothetical protein